MKKLIQFSEEEKQIELERMYHEQEILKEQEKFERDYEIEIDSNHRYKINLRNFQKGLRYE